MTDLVADGKAGVVSSAVEQRIALVEAELLAADHAPELAQAARRADTDGAVHIWLIEHFGVTEAQAVAMLDSRFGRATAESRRRLEDELRMLRSRSAALGS